MMYELVKERLMNDKVMFANDDDINFNNSCDL